MKRYSMIMLFVINAALSFMACTKKEDITEPAIHQFEPSGIVTPSPTIAIPPTISPTPSLTASPTPTLMPTPTPLPTPTLMPTPTPAVLEHTNSDNTNITDSSDHEPKNRLIAIDAGHQSKGNNEKEPIGPGSTKTKPKVSSGTSGIATKVPEYKLTLAIALKVKEELLNRGYEVYMIRESHDVNLSNRERAEMANESGADLFLRIHADGSENSDVSGTSTLYPSKDNPFVSYLYKESYQLSKSIVDAMCERTGARNRGAIARDDMSGINWCTIPVSIIEMGYMSNKEEDKRMQTEEYQDKMVQGICDGIDNYYKE